MALVVLAADVVLGHGVEGLQHQLAIGVSAGRWAAPCVPWGGSNMFGAPWGAGAFIHRNGVASSRRRAVLSADTKAGLIRFLELVSLAISMPGRLMARSLAKAA